MILDDIRLLKSLMFLSEQLEGYMLDGLTKYSRAYFMQTILRSKNSPEFIKLYAESVASVASVASITANKLKKKKLCPPTSTFL